MTIEIKKGSKYWNINMKMNKETIKFDYIKFIDLLYSGEEITNITFDKQIKEEEKKQINDMITEINDVVKLQFEKNINN